jgi:hypothetical protein
MKKLFLLLPVVLLLGACALAKPNFVFQEKTALDQNTGLVWTKNANMPGNPLLLSGADNAYEYVKQLNVTSYAGYADWRLPTKKELALMVEYAESMGYDRTKMETWPYQQLLQLGFVDVRGYLYWTGSRRSTTEMWTADMVSGKLAARPENKPYFLWPVRGNN